MNEDINTLQIVMSLFLALSLLLIALVEYFSLQSLKRTRNRNESNGKTLKVFRKRLVILNWVLIGLLFVIMPVVIYEMLVVEGYWIFLVAMLAVVYRFRIVSDLFSIERCLSKEP